jgi:hypothetical protein
MIPNHGGKRRGAGRKSTGRGNRKTLFLSDASMKALERYENASEFADKAILLAFGGRDKLIPVEKGLTLTPGQRHFKLLAQQYVKKYMEAREKRDNSLTLPEEFKAANKDINKIVGRLREDCFQNYYVHLDPITGASLNNKSIASGYLRWLNKVGKITKLENEEIELPLDRYYHEDESDMFSSIKDEDLAFEGGHQYDQTFFWVFDLLAQRNTFSDQFDVYYYRQAGVIRATPGSPRLLAHVLLGEKNVKAWNLYIIDAEPDESLNQTLLEISAFLKSCSHKLTFDGPLSSAHERQYRDESHSIEEYVEFTKNFWEQLKAPDKEQLRHCICKALQEKNLYWENGNSNKTAQNVYQICGLAIEIDDLMTRSPINMRSKFFLEIRERFSYHPITTSMEKWFFNKYLPFNSNLD